MSPYICYLDAAKPKMFQQIQDPLPPGRPALLPVPASNQPTSTPSLPSAFGFRPSDLRPTPPTQPIFGPHSSPRRWLWGAFGVARGCLSGAVPKGSPTVTPPLPHRYPTVTPRLPRGLNTGLGRNRLAISKLWGGIEVALDGFAAFPAVRCWRLDVRCWMFIAPRLTPGILSVRHASDMLDFQAFTACSLGVH